LPRHLITGGPSKGQIAHFQAITWASEEPSEPDLIIREPVGRVFDPQKGEISDRSTSASPRRDQREQYSVPRRNGCIYFQRVSRGRVLDQQGVWIIGVPAAGNPESQCKLFGSGLDNVNDSCDSFASKRRGI
ncbi:thioesterase superfamily protein, partial [Colletotrichum tofieldiae]